MTTAAVSTLASALVSRDIDVVQPFQLDRSNLRGRMVRLGPVLDEILGRHAYPGPVAQMLAETITLATTLAAALKYEGVFTLQTKGDGPINLMVADVTSAGAVRGYAQFDEDALKAALAGEVETAPVPALLGKGYLAFTVDQGEHTQRYQGIVGLDGDRMDDCVRHYFTQSEQLATGIVVHAGRSDEGKWGGGAIMLQALPDEDAGSVASDAKPSDLEDDWRRAMALLSTVTPAEVLDPALPVNDVLFRLFHEEEVRAYDSHGLAAQCRCSRERVVTVLRSLPREEVAELKVDGAVDVGCEFCSTHYRFDDAELEAVYGSAS
ncbi:Hsp33 family molecular chaperone HslO [Nitrospirillum viridazoti]|uniref:Molecular chaperone Hsp33 n=1 Tax=Nitrospirillum viridazoti CBAmc TaxID=1441467 RepID=A0A248JSV2_9PROT|nr:Hsp33 family molecular chaperone HslO [Nitrospirillum amazonense]ASG21561.1 molecular chaperone Hsp33 [Nitrospirillum amazonense CBAmc]TWB42301.1 molecular chaperone Hsp33 [Nitrospirillum amazonense]